MGSLKEIVYEHALTGGQREVVDGLDWWALKATRPDLRTRNEFRWPYSTNHMRRVKAPRNDLPLTDKVCPQHSGDGLSVALTAYGMAQGGYSPATLLVVGGSDDAVLATDIDKMKVANALVIELVDGLAVIRNHGREANLQGANLQGVDLQGVDLWGANLVGVDLWRANLREADLRGAKLSTGLDVEDAKERGAII